MTVDLEIGLYESVLLNDSSSSEFSSSEPRHKLLRLTDSGKYHVKNIVYFAETTSYIKIFMYPV